MVSREGQKMSTEISQVKHVEEISPTILSHGKSNDVNVYLSHPGWILLNTGTHLEYEEDGQASHVYYAVGWIGEGGPQIPRKQPPHY